MQSASFAPRRVVGVDPEAPYNYGERTTLEARRHGYCSKRNIVVG